MKHWKTGQEMGEGFRFNESEHKENEYNSLIKIEEHEKDTMRTFYLIRDVWSLEQIKELHLMITRHLIDQEDIDGSKNM